MTIPSAIEIERLVANRGRRRILSEISFAVAAGEIVGLLGPNGAGKTTTLAVLSTLLRPASGNVRVAGHDLRCDAQAVRRSIGRVPQEIALYPAMSARENVVFFARLIGLRGAAARRACEEALERVDLVARADDPASSYSGGMQRRLSLACGLLGSPPVLLLDEPTVGVDPQSRERIVETLRNDAQAGAALLYSTHLMEEAEQLCDRVVLLDRGRIVATGAPADLVRSVAPGLRIDVVTERVLSPTWLDDLAGARAVPAGEAGCDETPPANVVRVAVDRLQTAPRVLERAAARGNVVREFRIQRPNLNDAFLTLTGRAARD